MIPKVTFTGVKNLCFKLNVYYDLFSQGRSLNFLHRAREKGNYKRKRYKNEKIKGWRKSQRFIAQKKEERKKGWYEIKMKNHNAEKSILWNKK